MKQGYATVSRFIGSHNLSVGERQAEDYYASDPIAAEWLLRLESLENVWECACGGGHLSKVFETAGILGRSTDLIDRGYGTGGGGLSRSIRPVERGYCYESPVQVRAGVY